jgi:hypothetical protein
MRQILARLPLKTRGQVVDYARRTGSAGNHPTFANKYGPTLYFSRDRQPYFFSTR